MTLWTWCKTLFSGQPHFVVGTADNPYLLRWYLIPRNRLCNIYLHKFLRDDDDRALHDHPWASLSILLAGQYLERTEAGTRRFRRFSVIARRSEYRHRIELIDGSPAWTLFITGPKVREWGFWCPRGFVHWQEFVGHDRPGEIGRGCGEH